ncbi:MAG: methionyl-tRNA formyltransferase [Neisseria sp.]|nr:methionyl-tRNA formyltransferase [Neisseria sp.]
MKVIFAGTPPFAAHALHAVAKEHEVVCVLTQPDRPGGRGMKLTPSAVKAAAQQLNLPMMQPETLKDAYIQAALRDLKADVMVVAAYGLLLPQAVLDIPRYGCLNIHASLLPRWRGAAPIQRAIEAGDSETGVCIMQMDAGLDTGDVLRRSSCAITPDDTAQSVHDKLMLLGAQDIVAVLQQLPDVQAVRQTEQGITYAKKITKDEARIDWNQAAAQLVRKILAFNPVPGAWTMRRGQTLKIWRATLVDEHNDNAAKAGTVLRADADGIVVATAAGSLCITELQAAGGKRLSAQAFLSGNDLSVGEVLGAV